MIRKSERAYFSVLVRECVEKDWPEGQAQREAREKAAMLN
jgi:hypothetical protein